MRGVVSIGVLALFSMTTGCASIVNGQNQSVSVETRSKTAAVTGANCKLSNNKGTWFVTSPGSTTVQRSYEDLSVKCEKEGGAAGITSVKSSTKPMAFGNIIFGGVIGAGIDMANGSAYDYPAMITVQLSDVIAIDPAQAPVQTQPIVQNESPKQELN